MKKIIFLMVLVILISYAKAASNPDAIIIFTAQNKLDYITPNAVIKSRGQTVVWRVTQNKPVEICIKNGYINPFIAADMNANKPRCLNQTNAVNGIIEGHLVQDFPGIPFPEGGFIEVGYSVHSGGITLDPIIRIY
jgi:hypothetical protein